MLQCVITVCDYPVLTVVLCGDPALFELGAPLRTFYECSLFPGDLVHSVQYLSKPNCFICLEHLPIHVSHAYYL